MAQFPTQGNQPQEPKQGGGFFRNAMDAVFGNATTGNPNPAFGGNPPNPADFQNLQNRAPQGNPQGTSQNSGGVGPDLNTNNQQQNQQQTEQSPLDEFKDLWDPPKDSEGKPIVHQEEPLIAFDENKFNEALGKLDFTKTADPELMQKALGGDQQAMLQLVNGVGRSSLSMTTKMTKGLIESALTKQSAQFEKKISEQVKSSSARNSLIEENPALNHPALKPLLTSLEAQVRQKFPEASPAEITSHAKKALQAMAASIVGKDQNNNTENSSAKSRTPFGTDDVDWMAFASGEVNNLSKM